MRDSICFVIAFFSFLEDFPEPFPCDWIRLRKNETLHIIRNELKELCDFSHPVETDSINHQIVFALVCEELLDFFLARRSPQEPSRFKFDHCEFLILFDCCCVVHFYAQGKVAVACTIF